MRDGVNGGIAKEAFFDGDFYCPLRFLRNRITGCPVDPGRNTTRLFDSSHRPPRVASEFLRRQGIHQLVGIAVAADFMSRSHNLPNRARISLDHPTHDKKRGMLAPRS